MYHHQVVIVANCREREREREREIDYFCTGNATSKNFINTDTQKYTHIMMVKI